MMQSKWKRERFLARQLFLAVAVTMLCIPGRHVEADGPVRTLAKKTQVADAIVVAKVAEIEGKRYAVTLFGKGTFGKIPAMKTLYDLAVLHPEEILKTDSESMVNKADAANPKAWMHMGFETPDQPRVVDGPSDRVVKGGRRIWFLRHDTVLTGHYFLHGSEEATDDNIREIREVVPSKDALPKRIDTPEIILILEKGPIASIITTHSQKIFIQLKNGRKYTGVYDQKKAGKYAKDPKLSDIANLADHILDKRPKDEVERIFFMME